MGSRWPWLAAVFALAILGGCRTVAPIAPAGESWQVRRPQLQAREHFEFKGRVAVAAGGEGFNASLHWIQDGARSQVTLEGPLGVGGAQVSTSGNDLTLVTSRGERLSSDAAHAQLAARLGFDPPLASLRYWIQGVPDPGQPATEELDQFQQRLTGLTQDGWHVSYSSYDNTAGEALPNRMSLQRDAVRVRVLVDAWQL